jgi:hypothetical protein
VNVGCAVNLNSGKTGARIKECGQPAAYRAWTANCYGCRACDLPECRGHPVCVEHGAKLRTDAMQERDEAAVLARISSWQPERVP